MDVKPVHSYTVQSDIVILVSFFSGRKQEQPALQEDLHLEVENQGVAVSVAVSHHCENE